MSVCVVCIRQGALYSTGSHVRFLAYRSLFSSGVRTQLVASQGICNITRLTGGCASLLKASLFPLVLLRSLFYNIIPPLSSLSVPVERFGAVPPAGQMRTHQFVPELTHMRDPRFPQLCLPSSSHTVQ